MVETLVGRVLLDLGIVGLILASLLQVYADVSGREFAPFLPAALADVPSCEPATALSLGGLGLFAVGFAVELALGGATPSGRVIVGLIAAISFLFAGGFVVDEAEAEAGADADG